MGDETGQRWSPLTDRVLRSAAWYPDRAVPVDAWERSLRDHCGVEIHDAARRFLSEFGGLKTDDWTPGPIMPRSPFRFDPRPADAEVLVRLSEQAGTFLYPVGRADSGDSYLGMAADGTVYIGRDQVEPLADSADEAIERLVTERHAETPLPLAPTGDHPVTPQHAEPDEPDTGIGSRWSAETDRMLRLAGWRPGRSVSTEEWERELRAADVGFEIHPAARRFLSEFGGLAIDQSGPGRTMARSPFRLDPLVARWDYEIFEVLGEEAGTHLYPIGDADQGNFYLGMDPGGAVYLGMDAVRLLAGTGDEALDKLVRGIR